jgi:hypothetical protein
MAILKQSSSVLARVELPIVYIGVTHLVWAKCGNKRSFETHAEIVGGSMQQGTQTTRYALLYILIDGTDAAYIFSIKGYVDRYIALSLELYQYTKSEHESLLPHPLS